MADEDDLVIGPSEEEAFKDAFEKPSTADKLRDEQPRDEHGRFASPEEEPPEPGPEPQGEEQPVEELSPEVDPGPDWDPEQEQVTVTDDHGQRHTVPLHVHLDEREKRQKAEALAQQVSRELEAQRREWQKLQQPPPEVDPVKDPKAFAKQIIEQTKREYENRFLNQSFSFAHRQYGQEFMQAFSALEMETRRGNKMLAHKVTSAHDPGSELMSWFRQQVALSEIGGDIGSYRERVRQEAIQQAMQDPEFHRYYADVMNQQARLNGRQSYPRSGSENVTDLPSLNRATGSGGVQVDPGLGNTEQEVFHNAFAPRRR